MPVAVSCESNVPLRMCVAAVHAQVALVSVAALGPNREIDRAVRHG